MYFRVLLCLIVAVTAINYKSNAFDLPCRLDTEYLIVYLYF